MYAFVVFKKYTVTREQYKTHMTSSKKSCPLFMLRVYICWFLSVLVEKNHFVWLSVGVISPVYSKKM